jgi:HAD superfamily hydrolase (TIGR01509 family)
VTPPLPGSGPLAAVLFDLDGVLVASEPIWRAVEAEVVRRAGHELSEETARATKGLRIDEVVRFWRDELGWSDIDPEAVEAAVVDGVIEGIEKEPALPGALDAIATARRHGLKLAVASASPSRLLTATLRHLGLKDCFDAVISAEHDPYGKPHPAVFLRAADALGVAPTACLVVEDSANGVVAAKAARMRCVAVPEPGEALSPAFALADAVLTSLADFDDEFLARLGPPPS